MCGIFGFVTARSDVAARLDSEAALTALGHRGPDGSGRFASTAREAHCSFVHARLAIIDLSEGGRQPMRSANARYVITYNGEIYNHASVRRDLEREGVALRSRSDTEVILEAYARWGAACLDRLRGMFALAIWDDQLGELFLARDRVGIKPLYVARTEHTIAFASEVRALLAAKAAAPRLSAQGVRSYLDWGSVAEPTTILQDVTMLSPGTCLTYRRGEVIERTYWKPLDLPPRRATREEANEEIKPVLREAVRLRLVSDVPVGVFLSGGVDSSVITAIASSESTRPLHTFTVAFEEQALNEGEHASAVAARFGCEHHQILLSPDRMRGELDRTLEALDQPSADGTNTFFVAQAVRSAGISVALSGLGGDELFAGYGYFRQFGAARKLAGGLPDGASHWLESLVSSPRLRWLPSRAPKLAALLSGPRSAAAAYAALRCMFTPAQAERLLTPAIASASVEADAVYWGRSEGAPTTDEDAVNIFSVFEMSNYMRNTLLRDADVMSMRHALEVRVPLLDHRLIETVLPLAGNLKLSSEHNKPLLVAAAPEIPGRVTDRPKMGFTLPFDEWLRGPLRGRIEELLRAESVARLGVLSAPEVDRMWRAFLARDRRVTFARIWCLAALMAWCERNGAYL